LKKSAGLLEYPLEAAPDGTCTMLPINFGRRNLLDLLFNSLQHFLLHLFLQAEIHLEFTTLVFVGGDEELSIRHAH